MQLQLPKFQFRFVPAMGHVIHPGNFHPVGAQRSSELMIERAAAEGRPQPGAGGRWLVIGGSGGFGSAARVALGAGHGAHTLNVSFEAQPNPESSNKVRMLGSPGHHRTVAIERELKKLGLQAASINGDAFDPSVRQRTIETIRRDFGGKIDGLVWALAAPRALDPRSGKTLNSALRPLGRSVEVKTFSGREGDQGPKITSVEIPPGTPEEAIATIYVMGGRIVEQWIEDLLAAEVLAEGFCLLTISYRGNPLNEGVYRKGLIGLAKADLELHSSALDAVLQKRVGGQAAAVEGPAVVTEASGGIPGVPFYMALLLDVMGDRFEDPLANMLRMFRDKVGAKGELLANNRDAHGLVRMDDRELAEDVQAEMARRFAGYRVGDAFPDALYDRFMTQYAQTRGFDIPGIDYEAGFETDEVCR